MVADRNHVQDIEKLEKKAAKLEREKKEKEAQNKSRSLMANFFAKGQRPTQSDPKPGSASKQTDYERTFKPFILKKDAVLAPINAFRERPKSSASGTADDVIIVDDDEVDRTRSPPAQPRGQEMPRVRKRPSSRTQGQETVRELVTQLSEAEVTGDTNAVRALLTKLGDRKSIPAKVFIFKEDARPGYFGTWTRASLVINPRRPFGKDVVERDYGYDSGEDWEEEPAGDADDVIQDDDEEGGEDDEDSDADSWLVDDDEDDGPATLAQMDVDFPLDLPHPPKRKADDGEKNISKKRKVVVPLIPFAKGPFWEPSIGHCSYEPFNSYRIRLLNGEVLSLL